MKTFIKHETIIIKKETWKILRNLDRTTQGYSELTDEQLEKIWDRINMKNNGANPNTCPIAENEIRIDPDMFALSWNKIIGIIYKNGYEWRKDGYMINGIYV